MVARTTISQKGATMKRTPLRRKTAIKRGAPIARKPMRRGDKRSKYAQRPRDSDFISFVWTLPCAVLVYWMPWEHEITPCDGRIEADHMGDRARGRKATDNTCVPMCHQHHVERTIHHGVFWNATKDQLREWRAMAIGDTQRMYRERGLHP